MARESALWARIKTAITELRHKKHVVDLQRLENAVGTGHPDVEGCIDGAQIWIELKSNLKHPVRSTTIIHPKLRQSQSEWHRDRTAAGSRCHWVLIQVGDGSKASLYLIPGDRYAEIHASEPELELLSVVPPTIPLAELLLRALRGW